MNENIKDFVTFVNKEMEQDLEVFELKRFYNTETFENLSFVVSMYFTLDLLKRYIDGELDADYLRKEVVYKVLDYFTEKELLVDFEDYTRKNYGDWTVVEVSFNYRENKDSSISICVRGHK